VTAKDGKGERRSEKRVGSAIVPGRECVRLWSLSKKEGWRSGKTYLLALEESRW